MNINWDAFTPWTALSGGVVIGIAVALFAFLNGRVTGISGIAGGLFRPQAGDTVWRVAFLLGLVLAPLAWLLVATLPALTYDTGFGGMVLAGFVVGLSTRYGAGCTSGHGVCGMSRLSPRSIVATLSFMASGFITVYVIRHVLGV